MEGRKYFIENPEKAEIEYDRQSDILYIFFTRDVLEADEEILSEDGDIAYRIKGGAIISVMIMNFSQKIGGYIL